MSEQLNTDLRSAAYVSTTWGGLMNEAADRISELQAQLANEHEAARFWTHKCIEHEAQLEAVREYLQHREACTIYDPMVKGEVCTCGLEAAIKGDEI